MAYAAAVPLDLRKLAQFVAVAEERNFTRAAERLHLSQQALSHAVRQLERELGVALLTRTTRRVELTSAGRTLLEDGRPLLAAAARLRDRLGDDAGHPLRVGYTPGISGEQVAQLTRPLLAVAPGARFEARQLYPDALASALLAGELDVGLARRMPAPPGLTARTIAEHPLRVAVAATHRLAGRERAALRELADDRLVVWGRAGTGGYADHLIGLCREAGFEPTVRRSPMQGTPPVTSIVADDQFALVTDPPGPALGGRVAVLELDPAPTAPVRAIWNDRARPPLVEALLRSLAAPPAAAVPEASATPDQCSATVPSSGSSGCPASTQARMPPRSETAG